MLTSEDQAAAIPAGVPAGDPPDPTKHDDTAGGRVTSRGPGPSTAGASERYLAAVYRHEHGDPYQAPEEAKAREALSALIRRTWKEDRDMTRDERRLKDRYDRILRKFADADLEAYRVATAGKPDNQKGPGQ
ncbi:hypothetical protein [Arthrobacter sp. ISL-69]|uniref:hypothetical protein n=1 Tax=Arthrobacter sp. ISL-69 TaxID=2819113 RepID=UPI001BE704DE|nr:hypothetical protein [Arthrobacter sp. ISL-69]MBT2535884.1 hypothetical protein [Arthrobacter sp. ISL-69]